MATLNLADYPLPPIVDWAEWFATWNWEQGQHVAIIQMTGEGKTILVRNILPKRDFVAYFAVKPQDDRYTEMLNQGYIRVRDWKKRPRIRRGEGCKLLFWPPLEKEGALGAVKFKQAYIDALTEIGKKGGWCVALDDMNFMVEHLGLGKLISGLNYMVRASGISMVEPIQRPAFVPRSTWGQSKWVFLGGLADDEDLRTLRGVIKVPMAVVREWAASIPRYHWLVLPANKYLGEPVIVSPPL